ncbi:MAG: hypothetical protein R3F31_05750 [Verrucomicrobiales bacterium]
MISGLRKGTYAVINKEEYWAEGVQSWFDGNRENDFEHNQVNTREELKSYDPALAKLLREIFGTAPALPEAPEPRRSVPSGWFPDSRSAPVCLAAGPRRRV